MKCSFYGRFLWTAPMLWLWNLNFVQWKHSNRPSFSFIDLIEFVTWMEKNLFDLFESFQHFWLSYLRESHNFGWSNKRNSWQTFVKEISTVLFSTTKLALKKFFSEKNESVEWKFLIAALKQDETSWRLRKSYKLSVWLESFGNEALLNKNIHLYNITN